MLIVQIIARVASALLGLLDVAMLIRAILSWIPDLDASSFGDFIYSVTEPFIAPIRAFVERRGWFRNSPIDFSFLFTCLLIFAVQSMLSAFTEMFF